MTRRQRVKELDLTEKQEQEFAAQTEADRKRFLEYLVSTLYGNLPGFSKQERLMAIVLLSNAESVTNYLFSVYEEIRSILADERPVHLRPYFSPTPEDGRVRKEPDGNSIEINVKHLLTLMDRWNTPEGRYEARARVKNVIAHEMFHEYIGQKYPPASHASEKANFPEKPKFEYLLDRGEIACQLFSVEVLLQSQESNPEQRAADKKEAEILLRTLQDGIRRGRKDKQFEQKIQWLHTVLQKLPHTRWFIKQVDRFFP